MWPPVPRKTPLMSLKPSSTAPAEKKTDRRQVNRAKILAAATLEFGKDGVKGAKVDAIAASSGLTKRTLYKHFANKEAIFTGLLDDFIKGLDRLAVITYLPGKAFEDQLRQLIHAYVEAYYDEDFLKQARVITCELMKGRKISDEQIANCAMWKEHLSWWIDQAKEDRYLSSAFAAGEIATQFYEMIKAETFYPLLYGVKANTAENRASSVSRLTALFREFYATV